MPQLLKNVRYGVGQTPLDDAGVKAAIAASEAKLKGNGRLLIRKSGTEPLIRVTLEGEDEEQISLLAHQLAEVVRKELG